MRKIAEIRRDLSAKVAEVKALDPQKDQEAIEKGVAEVDALMKELHEAEVIEKAAQETATHQIEQMEKAAGRQFSFIKFLREASNQETHGQLTGLEAEVAKKGAEEYERLGLSKKGFVIPASVMKRAAAGNATTNTPIADVQPATYVEGLRAALVLNGLGAHVLGGLVGEVPIISSKAMTGGWIGEGEEAQEEAMAVTKVSLKPKRNYIIGAVTRDLLRQTSADVEAMIQNEILATHARLIDQAAINGSGKSGQPTGILNTEGVTVIAGDTNGKAIDWPNIVALETAVNIADANRGSLAYLTNGKVNGAMKVAEKSKGTGRFLLDGDFKTLNGYPYAFTSLVPSNLTKGSASSKCSAVIFGNFNDLFIGHWGGVDILVDPYTKAGSGEVRYVLNSYDDAVVREPKSFAVIKDVLA